jgi:hypothetical protein
MSSPHPPSAPTPPGEAPHHPIGTLVVIGLYGLLFALGWIAMYLFVFVPRGRVTP